VCIQFAGAIESYNAALKTGHPDAAVVHSLWGEALYYMSMSTPTPGQTVEIRQAYEHLNLGERGLKSKAEHAGRRVPGDQLFSNLVALAVFASGGVGAVGGALLDVAGELPPDAGAFRSGGTGHDGIDHTAAARRDRRQEVSLCCRTP
jgi:hypothetical protein